MKEIVQVTIMLNIRMLQFSCKMVTMALYKVYKWLFEHCMGIWKCNTLLNDIY